MPERISLMTAAEYARYEEWLTNEWLRKQPKRDTSNPVMTCRMCQKSQRERAMIYLVRLDQYICKGCSNGKI